MCDDFTPSACYAKVCFFPFVVFLQHKHHMGWPSSLLIQCLYWVCFNAEYFPLACHTVSLEYMRAKMYFSLHQLRFVFIFLVQLLDLWDKWSGCKATEGEFGVEVYHYYFELEPSANQHNQKQKENSLFFTGGSRDPKNNWWPTRSSLVAPGVFSDSSCSRWLLRWRNHLQCWVSDIGPTRTPSQKGKFRNFDTTSQSLQKLH